jgi:hypothetical protein
MIITTIISIIIIINNNNNDDINNVMKVILRYQINLNLYNSLHESSLNLFFIFEAKNVFIVFPKSSNARFKKL